MGGILGFAIGAAVLLLMPGGLRDDAQAQIGNRQVASICAYRPGPCSLREPLFIPPETLSGCVETLNGFGWKYGYDIHVEDNRLIVGVAVHLIPSRGITRPAIDRLKPLWKDEIEGIWSNKFAVMTRSGRCYPIVVDISFRGPKYHHEVIIHPGKGRCDQLNWRILNSPQIAAHEFGHMLGVFDEYKRGAVSPRSAVIDKTSIMTSCPTSGRTYARHYEGILEWFSEKTGLKDLALVTMDGLKNEYAEF